MQTQKIKTDILKREERRKQVAQYLQENMSETEIAQKLGVNLATIYRDIKHLKQVANDFVYSLAKKDIAYFYKDAIDDIKRARSKAWSIYNNCKDQQRQLNALKVVITSN